MINIPRLDETDPRPRAKKRLRQRNAGRAGTDNGNVGFEGGAHFAGSKVDKHASRLSLLLRSCADGFDGGSHVVEPEGASATAGSVCLIPALVSELVKLLARPRSAPIGIRAVASIGSFKK